MKRRGFVGTSAIIVIGGLAGCSSDRATDTEPSNGTTQTGSSNGATETEPSEDGSGPRGPEEAVEHYDNAVELIDKNADEFREMRQQLISNQDNVDFDATSIASRISEIQTQLDRAEEQDDGSLSDEIETLRRIALYQDTLSDYNEDYLRLTRLLNIALDEYSNGQHQPAIEVFGDAQQLIEPIKSSLEAVEAKLEEVQNSAEQAEMGDAFIQDLIITGESHTEIHVELTILSDLIPSRIKEVQGDLSFDQGFDTFEDENYSDAISHFSNAEGHFVAAKTQLENIDVEEVTVYIERLIDSTEALICEYEFSAVAADDLQNAANAMRNSNFEQANQHWDSGTSNLSRIGTC